MTHLQFSYPNMASVSTENIRAWMEELILDMPPATMRVMMRCCTHAWIVCTRSVGAGEYMPADSTCLVVACLTQTDKRVVQIWRGAQNVHTGQQVQVQTGCAHVMQVGVAQISLMCLKTLRRWV
jgi:hypothetical protein